MRTARFAHAMTPPPTVQAAPDAALRLLPIVFVMIWSTGWIIAGFAMPHAEPLVFLIIRFGLAGVILALAALVIGATWPASRAAWGHGLVTGVLLHAAYLGPVYWVIAQGLPTGISALLAAIQPILTAILAPVLIGERITARQWLGIGLGAVGLAMVLAPKLLGVSPDVLRATVWLIAFNALGMVSVTLGSLYQKKFVAGGDLRTITVVQYLAAVAVLLPFSLMTERWVIDWAPAFIGALVWSVFAVSIGAIGLYLWLIRRGAVSKAAALIYLVPPIAVLQSWLFFGETLTAVQIAGMIVTVAGVALTTRAT
jgi:drug/metabolite transporter (DMT)-like permease